MYGRKRYIENELLTSNPIQIKVLAYRRCIAELRIITEKIEQLRFSEVDERLIKIESILNELTLQLPFKENPVLSEKIEDLHIWIIDELKNIKIRKKTENIQAMINVLQDLLDAYQGVLDKDGQS